MELKQLKLIILLAWVHGTVYAETNQEVLDNWQSVSGQSGSISEETGELEWHGNVTQDVYHVDVESGQAGNTLSGLDEGNKYVTRATGDLRYHGSNGDVSYIQGGFSMTNDLALQSIYRTQVTNVQFGRAGDGYQLSAGDVVADFSKIGSSLGLRGLFASRQLNAFTMSGYAGTVANSWESLFNRPTLTGQPARQQYLRDVVGTKGSYQLNNHWSVFGTLQSYRDRDSSLNSDLAAFFLSQNGTTGTGGLAYQTERATLSMELGTSRVSYDDPFAEDASDHAVMIDAGYNWDTVSLQAGYHDLGTQYTSLSQNVLAGVREHYVSGNWFVTPNLNYGADVRKTDNRMVNAYGDKSPVNTVYSLSNWLTYSVEQLPGLSFSLQDTRNWGEINEMDLKTRSTSTMFTTAYANAHYSTSVSFSNSRDRDSTYSLSNSTTDGVQVTVGRQIQEGELRIFPSVSGNIQLSGGYQQQRIANGEETTSGNQGVSLSMRAEKLGQLQASISNMDTRQPNGGSTLNTKRIYFDWAKAMSEAFSFRAYISNSYINHGDVNKEVNEKMVGLQADYQW